MFEHVKRVGGLTMMACHVYDPTIRSVLTIAICNMQFEDTKSQSCMWHSMIKYMKLHGVPNFLCPWFHDKFCPSQLEYCVYGLWKQKY